MQRFISLFVIFAPYRKMKAERTRESIISVWSAGIPYRLELEYQQGLNIPKKKKSSQETPSSFKIFKSAGAMLKSAVLILSEVFTKN